MKGLNEYTEYYKKNNWELPGRDLNWIEAFFEKYFTDLYYTIQVWNLKRTSK